MEKLIQGAPESLPELSRKRGNKVTNKIGNGSSSTTAQAMTSFVFTDELDKNILRLFEVGIDS